MSIKTYLKAEDGAVTVDWVLITAALIGLSLAVTALLAAPFRDQSSNLQRQLERDDLICTDFCDRSETAADDAEIGEDL